MDNQPTTSEGQEQQFDPQTATQILVALMAANTAGYPRLQVRLDSLLQANQAGDMKTLQQGVADMMTFLQTYHPIDSKMGDFLKQYAQTNTDLLSQLQLMVGEPAPEAAPKLQSPLKPKINVKKLGQFYFPFYMHEKLDLGNIADLKTIKQNMNMSATHYKLWKDINGIPFVVNGYPDDAYSCVTRVLASQAGKLLGLQGEEVFFGNSDGKPVTLTAFSEVVTLLESITFQLYQMASNYEYQSEQKRAFYFLIQHWTAYSIEHSQVKERYERHFIDAKGNVFLSQHEFATFLTPQQMSSAMIVRLHITKDNYRPIRDLIIRVGDRDVAAIVFDSIPLDMVEQHDQIAVAMNKPSFDQRREAFDSNWERLKEALQEFESQFGV